MTEERPREYRFFNYALCFIDLLGQRDAMHGEGLLPNEPMSNEDRAKFITKARKSIGAISHLQRQAKAMVAAFVGPHEVALRAKSSLSRENQAIWDELTRVAITEQRWSDGLVYFVNLGDEENKCPIHSVHTLLMLAGCFAFLGLATGQPIRGGIEVAWGIELQPGEIYGPAVARAYELESEVAKYPRVVVGPLALGYLRQRRNLPASDDIFVRYERELGDVCLRMLAQDSDGIAFVDYLGDEFQYGVTRGVNVEIYRAAIAFVETQVQRFQAEGNKKLHERYEQLLRYFCSRPPLEHLQEKSSPA
jgi:hypothetical protein